MRSPTLFTQALLLAASTAWPFDSPVLQVAKRELAPLILPRQTTTFDLSFSGTEGNTATTSSTASSSASNSDASTTGSTSGSQSASASGSQSGSTSGSQSGSASGSQPSSNSKTTPTSSPSFDPRLPPGGVEMITPNVMTGKEYYKIQDWVTFAWNFTSLSVTPTAVDVLASCSANQATYTIALNQSIPTSNGSAQTIYWDTGAYQATATVPLLTETYTLIIYDAQSSISATAGAGYLAPWDQFTFGMYVPQAYTPIADWVCATCSGATSVMEKQTMGFLFGMVGVTVLSFTWFAGVAGLW